MPYKISETPNGFNVVNTETGKIKNAKPYLTRDDALKYHRALSAAETTKELFTGLLDFFGFKKKPSKKIPDFTVFKDASGAYRWVLISSNAYRDRDGEIVSTKALQEDVDYADAKNDYGELDWWHVDGTEIGDCDFNMMHGKMLVESGTFYDKRVAEAVSEKSDELEVSIAFRHPSNEPDTNGVFHNIRRFKRSLVPKGRASNRFTSLAVTKGDNMSTLAEKLQAFKALLQDEELANSILQKAEAKEKEADAAGVAFKEDGDGTGLSTTVTPNPETLTPAVVEAPADPFALLAQKLDTLSQDMNGLKQQFSTTKDDTAARELERQTTLKAYGDKLSTLEGNLSTLAKAQQDTLTTLKAAQKEVKLLMGDLPAGVGAFIASQSRETEVPDEDARLKSSPQQDPENSFMSDFVFHGMPLADQMNGK